MKRLSQRTFYMACGLVSMLAGPDSISADNGNIVVSLSDPLMSLTAPFWTNGEVRFALNGETNVSYVIESSPDLLNWMPVATNPAAPVVTVGAPANVAFCRVRRNPLPLFAYAVAARENINMNGTGLVTDSFNSSDTNLSTNGQYDPTRTSTNGDVASADGIVNISSHTINGSAYLGPAASSVGGANGAVTGTIFSNYDVQFPDVLLPATNGNGNSIDWHPALVIGGTNVFLTNGYYYVPNSNAIYVAPGVTATLQVGATNFTPASMTVDGGLTNSGTLVIYQDSGEATLGNTSGVPVGNRARNFIFLGLPGLTNIVLNRISTTNFVGAIYAPSASITLSGSGAIMGSCIVGALTQNSHVAFHFDESLLTSGPFR